MKGCPRGIDADCEPVADSAYYHQLLDASRRATPQALGEAIGDRLVMPEPGPAGGDPESGRYTRGQPRRPVETGCRALQIGERRGFEAGHPH